MLASVPFAPAVAQTSTGKASTDDIFRQVFGKKKAGASVVRRIDVPVFVGRNEAGTVPVRVVADPTRTQVAIEPLVSALSPLIRPDVLARLRRVPATQDGFAAVADLSGEGLTVAYDPAEVALSVSVDPALRRAVDLDLGGAPRPPTGNAAIEPATVSAFTNIVAAEEWNSASDALLDDGRAPLGVAFGHALNVKGVVLEAESYYREGDAKPWQRGNLRLTKDFVEQRVRASLGDFIHPATGFQASQPLGGLVIARNFQLQPYTLYQPSGRQDFVLTDPATVEIVVNGRPARTYRLAPGSYNLRNFPGTLGTNDVTIRITDTFGRTQTISVPFFFDNQLLAEGVHEFAYAAGLPATSNFGDYHYDDARPALSGFHRFGVTDQLTLGINAQGDRDQRLIGGEALFSSVLGTIGIEPAASFGRNLRSDGALRLSYRYFALSETYWNRRSVNASATWYGADFAPLGTTAPSNPVKLDLAARLSQPITESVSASLGGRYQFSRDPGDADAFDVTLLLRSQITRNLSLDFSVERGRQSDGERETAAFASLRLTFDDFRQALGASADSRFRERRIEWRYRDLEATDSLYAGVQLTKNAEGHRAEGDATYVHQRFIVAGRSSYVSRLNDDPAGGNDLERRTALSFSTGLVFADGHFGVTRPVSDSFAIVAPHPRLKGKTVGVDPFGERYAARSDFLGPPVLPDLGSYRQRALLLDVPDAPVNHDLGNDRPVLEPSYRSGLIVPIGTDAAAGLAGVLADSSGAPLALQSGVLRSVDGGAEILFFSNRKGRFRIEGVRPGDWRLIVFGMEDRPITVTVPPEADNLIELGVVRP